ncbi:MAG TPA: DUF3486 family protein [Thiotrichales bacterium]|nr:DUF3486 family protein [Thiotrichales bacterium]
MTETATHKDKLRRLRVLQRLGQVSPNPMGEMAMLESLHTDPELHPDIERVRQTYCYLEEKGLVSIVTVPDVDWMAASLSFYGQQWLESPGDFAMEIYSPGELPEPVNTNHRGRVSSIETLPTETKAWLDQELVRRGFSGYSELAEMLASRGYELSRSALGRYGKKFKDEQKQLKQSIEMAKAFAEVIGDDGAAMNQTLTALMQQELMTVIRNGQYDEEIKLPELARSIASLNRSDINTRKYQIEQAARKQAIADAADAVEQAAIEKGMDSHAVDFWRKRVLGVK